MHLRIYRNLDLPTRSFSEAKMVLRRFERENLPQRRRAAEPQPNFDSSLFPSE
jgi:hypothetical protein